MEEDDETQTQTQTHQSLQSPNLPLPKPKSSSSSQSPNNALALVVHTPKIGGGRDDCWSEEATKVLIEAWGDRFTEPGKGTLKQQQWKQVAEIVNDSGLCKYPKTDIQCKNRIDTVKKKYKQEKVKVGNGDGISNWIFFKKLESLIGTGNNGGINNSNPTRRRSVANNRFKRQVKGAATQVVTKGTESMRWHFRKRSASETESESDPEPEGSNDSAESLPPVQPVSFKRMKVEKTGGGGEGEGVGEVAKAIMGFTEAYEKAEMAKLKLMMELEKERMKFAKEMELQRMQFLKTQMEISAQNVEEEEWRRNVDDDDDDDDRGVKNNGDLWDETVAGPTPENGLRKLRNQDSLSTVRSSPPSISTDQVTRSIIVTKGSNNVRGLRKLKMDHPGRAPDSPIGSSSHPGTPLTPGTPCDHFGPFTADKIPSSGENDASSFTTYEWILLNALDR